MKESRSAGPRGPVSGDPDLGAHPAKLEASIDETLVAENWSGQRRLLASLMHSISDGVIVADRSGKFLVYNQAAKTILGIGPLDVSMTDWPTAFGCYLPDKVTPYPPHELPLARALRGEQVTDAEIFVRNAQRPSGAWISANSSPLLDEHGERIGGVVIFRDISSRRRTFEVVRQLSKAVEQTADTVFITDVEGRIEYVNPAFEKTTGYGREEVIGRTPNLLKSGEHGKEYYDALWSTILAGKVHAGTVINRKKNGELYHAEQTITPIQDSAGNLTNFVSVVKDVTELKRAKEREVELRLARVVQQRLYPTTPPKIPGYDLAGAASSAEATGGDYFDFIPMADDALAIAIGDVSGHGFGPSLFMAETRAYLRSLTRTYTDVAEVLQQINAFLSADTELERFVTLLVMRLDPARRSFVYASAGHLPGYLIDGSGKVKRELRSTGPPLGIYSDLTFPGSEEIELEVGDTILLITDGVVEMHDPDGNLFGAERALEVVRSAREFDARIIVDMLHAAALEFAGPLPQLDDVTAVVCKVAGPF